MSRVRKSLGEIALRVINLDQSIEFYQHVINLELMRQSTTNAFFKVADGLSGHTQVLALFDRSQSENYVPPSQMHTTIDHIAFSVSRQDFETEKQRLLGLGFELSYAYHEWVHWRSLYLSDPEGNIIEFVCYDPDATNEIQSSG